MLHLLKNKSIHVMKAEQIVPEYKKALETDTPTILVEIPDLYNKDPEDKIKEARKNIIT